MTSRLSPYLHWGHLSNHRIFRALAQREGWTPEALVSAGDGTREGWWGMGESAEEWSPTPRAALETMIRLNDRWAVDGRDPNSYSGIFWCLGRFDRGWPERPVFGKVRSMSSDATRRKVSVTRYPERFAEEE